MANRSPTIIDRADEVDTDLVPEPWDDRDAAEDQEIVTRRERYRLQGATDGQGAGIVPAYALDVAGTEAIPSKTKDGWTRGSAGRVLGPNGKYVSRESDVPRKSFDGEDPGLLVEAAGRTNIIDYSSDITAVNWRGDADFVNTSLPSIIDGKNATKLKGTSISQSILQNPGSFTGNDEVYYVLYEVEGSGSVKLNIVDRDASDFTQSVLIYDPSTETVNFGDSNTSLLELKEAKVREIKRSGPNGGQLLQLQIRYEGTGGNKRRIRFRPDADGVTNTAILHHVQLEEAPNASSPIVTSGSPVTRSADDYAIFEGGQPPWWNPNEGTFVMNLEVRSFFNKPAPAPLTLNPEDDRIFVAPGGPPYSVFFRDKDGNDASINSIASPYQSFGLALSLTSSEARLSVNGSSDIIVYDGNGLGASEVSLTRSAALYSFGKIIYTPRALPEPTLNQITS